MHLRIDFLASAAGIVGALLIALTLNPVHGFAVWLISNVAWIAHATRTRQWPLAVQQLFFLATSVLGLAKAFGLLKVGA